MAHGHDKAASRAESLSVVLARDIVAGMARLAVLLWCGWILWAPAVGAKAASAKAPSGKKATATLTDGEWEYRFSEDSISKADLLADLDFSDHSEVLARLIHVSPSLQVSRAARAGGGWGAWEKWGPEWTRKSRAALDEVHAGLQTLKEKTVPPELEPARTYVVDEALLSYELEMALLDVVEKNDAAALASRKLPGVAIGNRCDAAVKKVEAQPSREGKLEDAQYEWVNCVVRQKGTYPQAAWRAFLKRYRVTERHDTSANE